MMPGPKFHITDPDIIEKARAMCSRFSDERISDYLGMALPQVASIRRNNLSRELGRPKSYAPMRNESKGLGAEHLRREFDAMQGSDALLAAMQRVFGEARA